MRAAGREVIVVPTSDALTEGAAERVVQAASGAIAATGRFLLALSGGSTPRKLYTLLAMERFARRIDWTRVHVFWGDERCVPPDDPASNYRMARESLLDHVPVPPANVHRIRGEGDPATAAAAYEAELRVVFATPDGPPRSEPGSRFDLVLLGMGDNGHTASLFPGLGAVRETRRWVVAEWVGEVSMWRITLTPPAINAAAETMFLVTGQSKAAMLRRVLEGPHDPKALPSQAIAPVNGRLIWLVDAVAASRLGPELRKA